MWLRSDGVSVKVSERTCIFSGGTMQTGTACDQGAQAADFTESTGERRHQHHEHEKHCA